MEKLDLDTEIRLHLLRQRETEENARIIRGVYSNGRYALYQKEAEVEARKLCKQH